MKVNIQIQCTAKSLNQGDGAGVRHLVSEPRLPDQVCGNHTVDNTQHPSHDRRTAGQEEPQRICDTEVHHIQTIIDDGSISAQANVGAHFSQRAEIYHYPKKVGETDFVILRLESPTQRLHPYERTAVATLAHHLMMNPSDYLDSIRDILIDTHYGIVFWHAPGWYCNETK